MSLYSAIRDVLTMVQKVNDLKEAVDGLASSTKVIHDRLLRIEERFENVGASAANDAKEELFRTMQRMSEHQQERLFAVERRLTVLTEGVTINNTHSKLRNEDDGQPPN